MNQALNAIESTTASAAGVAAGHGGGARDAGHRQARVISLPEAQTGAATAEAAGEGRPVLRDWSALHQIKTRVQVSVGEADVTVGELMGAKSGHVIRLDSDVEQPVTLLIEGHVVARGQLVAVDGHFAVRLTEMPIPLNLGTGS
ncbi:MAG: FliM/FliN family flagellar motor C-terminal domain-containing protein [Bordetella sp.]|nr:FliM/FliN family flagellar motor C-terminal domain-containing protein [Bordetella sp.]